MSFLPQISQQQRRKNIVKLIQQNKKLRQQIFQFQVQINHIVSKQKNQDQFNNTSMLAKIKRSSSFIDSDKNNQNKQNANSLQQHMSQSTINKHQNLSLQQLLQINSPLIQRRIIPQLKQQLQQLKANNIKQNIHYILQEQDELKIIKKQLNRLKVQKEVFIQNVKVKSVKLQKENKQLQEHKQNLREQLKQIIRFNRKSNANIVELQRDIRKHHLILYEYKKLKGQISGNNQGDKKLVQKIKQNPNQYIDELETDIIKYKKQIKQVQDKWTQKIQALNSEYCKLKQQLQKKQNQKKIVQLTQNFFITRILVMKDQQKIKQQKSRQSLVKVNPQLQKQLEQYLKLEQQKIRKKQQYLKKHRPRQPWQNQNYFDSLIANNDSSPTKNKNQPIVQTQHNDKNISKLKNYLKLKQKMDKQIQAKMKKRQKHRIQRSWSSRQQSQEQDNKDNNDVNKNKQRKNKQAVKPRILLKSIKLGTTFVNQDSQEERYNSNVGNM